MNFIIDIRFLLIHIEIWITGKPLFWAWSGTTENVSEMDVGLGFFGFDILWWHKPVVKPKNHWAFIKR
jgi:hypothetical protein